MSFPKSLFEFLEDGSGLRAGCGVGTVRDGKDCPRNAGFKLEKFSGCFAPGGKPKKLLWAALSNSAACLVESRDGIRKSAFPCFRCALPSIVLAPIELARVLQSFHSCLRPSRSAFQTACEDSGRRSLDPRVHLHDQRLRGTFSPLQSAARCNCRQSPCSQRIFWRVMNDRENWKLMPQRFRAARSAGPRQNGASPRPAERICVGRTQYIGMGCSPASFLQRFFRFVRGSRIS